ATFNDCGEPSGAALIPRTAACLHSHIATCRPLQSGNGRACLLSKNRLRIALSIGRQQRTRGWRGNDFENFDGAQRRRHLTERGTNGTGGEKKSRDQGNSWRHASLPFGRDVRETAPSLKRPVGGIQGAIARGDSPAC